MGKISFLDLKRVNDEIDQEIGQAVNEVLNSGWYILGKKTEEFELNFVKNLVGEGNGFAIGCNSGTDALILSLRAGGVSYKDEVVTVSHTAIPTISAIVSVGAVPVFVDICPETWVMDKYQIEAAITSKTKAIICVHLYGNMVDVIEIKNILKRLGREDIIVIEDVAQAQGSSFQGQQAGTIADFGAFSFYPSKNIGALGDGGAVFVKSEAAYNKLLMYRNYGQKDRYNALVPGGINSRLDEIQASVLNVKLKYLHRWNKHKMKLMSLYRDQLKGLPITFQKITDQCVPGWHLCVIELNENIDRDKLIEKLSENGLQTLIHYPYPTHLQKAFAIYATRSLLHTEKLAKQIISLPFSYVMQESEIEKICAILKKSLKS